MADEVDQKVLDRAYKLKQDGKPLKEILELTGLTYAQAWLYITDKDLPANQRVKNPTATKIVHMREVEQNSWGLIVVRCGYKEFTEGQVRKMYREGSGSLDIGQRTGKGGRFLNNDGVLYAGDRRRPGIKMAVGTKRSDIREISASLANGQKPGRSSAPVKKAAAKAAGAVKTAKKAAPVKKVVAKKAAKKVATPDVDPFS